METNVMLNSKDRDLFGIVIKQETKTGFLSLTELQKAYEVARWQYGWNEKHIPMMMQSNAMVERIYYLLYNRGLVKVSFLTFTEMIDKEGITKVLKGLRVWRMTGKGSNRVVMADPYIWVAIALELNPMIYAKVIEFITDSLLFDRIEAGDEYRPMNEAIKKIIPQPDYPKYSIAINKKVFGVHKTGMRNLASAQELKRITKIEQFIKQGIDIGMIKNDEQVLYAINNINL